ncbi:hypothetical protein PHMEG_00032255 [Phytophthora megakarya]|uniref:Uncharacterized protein n=1 Tax=Phytophthora megakarya TaxID=4795 RepID=A0A225UXJ3_9STRA|nr:hypothetical protein PHMEG_00032255 [Phytophthora megakarya]
MVFRGIPEQLIFVGEYCLASLVYHIPFLRTHLPSCHPLFETALFQDTELLVKLSDRVYCSFSDSTSILKATGVPPHVAILGKMKAVQGMTMSTIEKLDDVRRWIVKDIVRELEERAIEPHHGIETDTAGETTTLPTFFWARRFRRIPPDFAFPECSVVHLWVLRCCGHAKKKIEAIAAESNLLSSTQTVEEAIHIYTVCASSVEVPSTTVGARKRRRGQFAWTPIVRLHRIADKNGRNNTQS